MCEQPRQGSANGFASAAAADHRGVLQGVGSGMGHPLVAQHQLGPQHVDGGRMRVQQLDIDPACAGGLRRPRGKQGGAGHAGRAAHDGDITETALVLGMPSARRR